MTEENADKKHGYVDDSLWERLTELGCPPHKNPGPDSTGLKQAIGLTEHNIFVYNKKDKSQKFFVTVRQKAKINLKQLAKDLGVKELRMCSSRVEDLKSEVGCITLASLFYDKECKIQWVLDEGLLDVVGPWRFCAGCLDVMDHANHNVTEITWEKICELIPGHAEKVIKLKFELGVEDEE